MNIGIIGYGKMGKDIFSLFFDRLPDAHFTVLDLMGAEENTDALLKTLGKSLKRKKLTEEQYDFKKNSFLFTDSISDMKDCDIIIEAVFEDMKVKQDIFRQLAGTVSESCLLLTNTSSLKISDVFDGVPHRERCFGLHFFYPVKLSSFVELNVIPDSSEENIAKAKALVAAGGKKPIVFEGSYHIYLNQLLSCMIGHAIIMKERRGVSLNEMNNALAPFFSIAAPFDILDSVGLGLMGKDPESFSIPRNRQLHTKNYVTMKAWTESGCPQAPLTFLGYMAEKETDTGNVCENAELDMTAFLLNETVNALEEYSGDKNILFEAICDTLGLAEAPLFYYKKFGTENIFSTLDKYAEATGFAAYNHKDKSVWDRYFR